MVLREAILRCAVTAQSGRVPWSARAPAARRRESLAAIESAIRSTRVAEEEARGRERVGAARCREMRETMEAMRGEMREMETRVAAARWRVGLGDAG